MRRNRYQRVGIAVMGAVIGLLGGLIPPERAAAALFSQAPAAKPIRLGDVGRQVTEQDVSDLARFVPSTPGGPWLIAGREPLPSRDWHNRSHRQVIDVYFPAESTTGELRRGIVISASRMFSPGATTQEAWTKAGTESYAQVSVPGRGFDAVTGDEDIIQPFRVIGRFDDAELVRVVSLIRSRPPGPRVPERVEGGWRIASITRNQDDSVVVWLQVYESARGQHVTLSQQGALWIVVDTRYVQY